MELDVKLNGEESKVCQQNVETVAKGNLLLANTSLSLSLFGMEFSQNMAPKTDANGRNDI